MRKEDATPTEKAGAKVLVKPLPHILNELEGHIKAAETAARRANDSAG